MSQPYLMESPSEGTRLRAKTDPQIVQEELLLTGLAEGAVAVDAGCASGAVTREMAARVGPGGLVHGIDLSLDRLREAKAEGPANTRYLRGDLTRLPLRDGVSDYTLCRLVLEYVAEPLAVTAELLRVTRPGGRVVLIDVDGYGAFHWPLEGEHRQAVETIAALLERAGFDAYAGRKLWSWLRKAGARDVTVHQRPYHLVAGAADPAVLANWEYKLTTLAKLGRWALGPEAYDRAAAGVLDLLRDPETLSYSTIFIVEGTRP